MPKTVPMFRPGQKVVVKTNLRLIERERRRKNLFCSGIAVGMVEIEGSICTISEAIEFEPGIIQYTLSEVPLFYFGDWLLDPFYSEENLTDNKFYGMLF